MMKGGAPHAHEPHATPASEAVAAKRLEREVAELKEQYVRQLADLENTRKRLARDQAELSRFAAEHVIRELLPIVDSLDQALVAVDQRAQSDAVVKGVHLIYRQLLGLLEKQGVVRIPTVGEPFDPHRHEAVAEIVADGQAPQAIVEEVQVGYTMHGKVIRPAMVKVAKSSPPTTGEHNNG